MNDRSIVAPTLTTIFSPRSSATSYASTRVIDSSSTGVTF